MAKPTLSTAAQQSLDKMPVSVLRGVGAKLTEQLAKRDLHTVQDLLFHLPLRYQDRTRVTPMADVQLGEFVVVEGEILSTETKRGRKMSLYCTIQEKGWRLGLRFFHFSGAQRDNLKVGRRIRCFGEVRRGASRFEMIHPEYRFVDADKIMPVAETLTPIYPTTEGLSQHSLRQLADQALQFLKNGAVLQEHFPQVLLEQYDLAPLAAAVEYVHCPPPDANQEQLLEGIHPMQQRLAFEELVAHQISLRRLRDRVKHQQACALTGQGSLQEKFLASLPFKLTAAQGRVVDEIATDLAQASPMLRLVQGDVGSGKTVVAAMSMLQAIEQGKQAVLMAPTELLAEQHFKTFERWLAELDIKVAWLSGKMTAKQRKPILAQIAAGEVKVVVGTHALFQKDVEFADLVLVVIDEQHRFGVHQRLALKEKGEQASIHPHQLIMTATPIPRTLAMTAYADLDTSVIDELPPGRTPVTTVAISNEKRGEVIQRVRQACEQKRQAYWVCTLIEESEVLQCQAAEATAADLQEQLPALKVALIHGRLKPAEKEAIMASFQAGETDLLVATTVIEVGVDVPNASLMIIENPERLGLAQLHQLRGRVGRGSVESHCVLLYQLPLSQMAKSRLGILRETNDGFKIAQRDLELRGPGEVLGTRQTGNIHMRIANIVRDQRLLPKVQRVAQELLAQQPQAAECIVERWLGSKEQYGMIG